MERALFSRFTFASACLAGLLALAAPARAQSTGCPPGQPCVVVQSPQASGYVTVQPVQPVVQQQVQPMVYAAPQRQPVEVTHTRLRWGLIGPGIGLFVGGWVGNWITGLVGGVIGALSSYDTSDYVAWSWVPLVGPWVNAAYYAGNDGMMGMHVLWGILQAGGLLMCILGTALPEEVTEIRYVEGDTDLRFAVMPWADATGGGASVRVTGF